MSQIFKKLNSLKPGTCSLISGSTGSGKTSFLLNLLKTVLPPDLKPNDNFLRLQELLNQRPHLVFLTANARWIRQCLPAVLNRSEYLTIIEKPAIPQDLCHFFKDLELTAGRPITHLFFDEYQFHHDSDGIAIHARAMQSFMASMKKSFPKTIIFCAVAELSRMSSSYPLGSPAPIAGGQGLNYASSLHLSLGNTMSSKKITVQKSRVPQFRPAQVLRIQNPHPLTPSATLPSTTKRTTRSKKT